MPTGFDIEHGLGHDRGPHVIPRASQLRQAGQHVHFGQRVGGGLQPVGGAVTRSRKLHEHVVFQCLGLLFGREDLFFVLFQLRRDVPLRILERLFADVFGRHLVAMGVRDFQVVAEHLVESDLDAGDAGAFGFGSLVLGHPLLAAGHQRT